MKHEILFTRRKIIWAIVPGGSTAACTFITDMPPFDIFFVTYFFLFVWGFRNQQSSSSFNFPFHLVCSYSYLAPKLPLGLAMTHLTEMSCGRPTTTELLLVTSKFRSQITYVVVVLKVCLCLHGRWWRNRSYHKMRILCRNKTQMMMNHLEEMRIVYILNYQFRGGLMFCNAWVFDRLCNLLLSQCCSCVLDVQRGCARRNIFVLPYF